MIRRMFPVTIGSVVVLVGSILLSVRPNRTAHAESDVPEELVSEFSALQQAIEVFYGAYGYYPPTLEKAWNRPYIHRTLDPDPAQWDYSVDPSGDTYHFAHRRFRALHRIDPADPAAVEEGLASPIEFLRREAVYILSASPENTGRLTDVIRSDPSPKVQGTAVFLLNTSPVRSPSSVTGAKPAVLEALLDPDHDVWDAAARVLVRSASEFVTGEMVTWAGSGDRERRMQCARALSALDDDLRWEPLAKLLEDPDEEVRESAIRSLTGTRREGCPDWVREKLLAMIRENSGPLRLACARSAAELGLVEAVPILDEALAGSITKDEIFTNLYPLACVDSEAARKVIRRFLSHDDPETRRLAIQCLRRRPYPQRCSDVAPLLKDPDRKVRLEAVSVVRSCAEEWVIPPLLELFDDENGEVRAEATMVVGGESPCYCPWHTFPTPLGRLKDPRTVKPLLNALNDPDSRVRVASAIALSQYRLPETADALIASLTDTAEWKNYGRACDHIGHALHEMGVPVSIERLRDYILRTRASEPYIVAGNLIRACSEKEKLEELVRAELPRRLRSDDEREVIGALTALTLFSFPEFDRTVIEVCSRHPSSLVRVRVIEVLRENRSPRWKNRLAELTDDPSDQIRHAAAAALEEFE